VKANQNMNEIEQELDSLISHTVGYCPNILSKQIDYRRLQMLIKAYDTAVETRRFEIELFWKRALFFWGFIASSFVAYATLMPKSLSLSIVIACFGFICSVAWSLSSRGSKFWQETWELKVHRIEPMVTGAMFSKREPEVEPKQNEYFQLWKQFFKSKCREDHRKKLGYFWLRSRMFSVSKLAIALSDYTVVLWGAVIVESIVRLWINNAYIRKKIHTILSDDIVKYVKEFPVKEVAVTLFVICSVVYFMRICKDCRHIPDKLLCRN